MGGLKTMSVLAPLQRLYNKLELSGLIYIKKKEGAYKTQKVVKIFG